MREVQLRRMLENRGDFSKIQKLDGSSSSEVYRAGNSIYKLGADRDIQNTFNASNRFKTLAPNCHEDIFPKTELVQLEAEQSLLNIEYVGSRNFEQIILGQEGPDELKDKTIRFIHSATLQNLAKIYKESMLNSPIFISSESEKFVQELLSALTLNLNKAGMLPDFIDTLDLIQLNIKTIAKNCTPSLAHKDLSTGNIVISDDNTTVKFIDARLSVPQLSQSETGISIGNVAFDIIGYQTSLLRKQLELNHSGKDDNINILLKDVSQAIEMYIKDGVFSRNLMLLCEAVWYSVYAACNCSYCTSPERKWLYDLMTERSIIKLNELRNNIE